MNEPIHKDLANGRWLTMTLSEQLANVGSEFSRAYRAKEKQNEARFQPAFLRLLELLNLTLQDTRWTGCRKKEIARLKENILDNIMGDTARLKNLKSLDRYFYYFGVSRKKEQELNAKK